MKHYICCLIWFVYDFVYGIFEVLLCIILTEPELKLYIPFCPLCCKLCGFQLSDKEEALAHQRKVSYMLARNTEDLEKRLHIQWQGSSADTDDLKTSKNAPGKTSENAPGKTSESAPGKRIDDAS